MDGECLDAYSNMAIDETLLRSFHPSFSRPVFRLYGWDPPALSLGRFQKAGEAIDLERSRAEGVAVVRRITGGGVIYHSDELTYSIVCAPQHIPATSSVRDSFRVLTRFLLNFYGRLGFEAVHAADVAPPGSRLGGRPDFCFAGREPFDILINGRKIGGNAQYRSRKVIFQHGSVPLSSHVEKGLSYMRKSFAGCEPGIASLAELGSMYDRNALRRELAEAFRDSFNVELEKKSLSPDELARFNALRTNKYTTDRWNLEGMGK